MNITAKILEVKKDRLVQSGEEFLEVAVALLQEGKKKPLEVRKYSFPIETSEKEIEKQVKKSLEEFKLSRKQAEAQAKVDAKDSQTNKTKKSLEGKTIS